MISMETVLAGSSSQMMATLLKLLAVDLIKHFCTYYLLLCKPGAVFYKNT